MCMAVGGKSLKFDNTLLLAELVGCCNLFGNALVTKIKSNYNNTARSQDTVSFCITLRIVKTRTKLKRSEIP